MVPEALRAPGMPCGHRLSWALYREITSLPAIFLKVFSEVKGVEMKKIHIRVAYVMYAIITVIILGYIVIAINNYYTSKNIVPIEMTVIDIGQQNTSNEIIDVVRTQYDDMVDRTYSNLNISIALLSCGLVMYTIVFGLFYFTKLREVEKTITLIKNSPNDFFRAYYKEQFNDTIPVLYSDNNILRTEAIKKISYNTELTNSDYNIIYNAMNKEFSYMPNPYQYENVGRLVNVLNLLDNERTIEMLVDLIKNTKEEDYFRVYGVIIYVIVDNSEVAQECVMENMKKGNPIGNYMVSLATSQGVMDNYIDYILEKCPDKIVVAALSNARSYPNLSDIEMYMDKLKTRKIIGMAILQPIMYWGDIKLETILDLLMHGLRSNSDELEKYGSIIDAYCYKIKEHEEAIKAFREVLTK